MFLTRHLSCLSALVAAMLCCGAAIGDDDLPAGSVARAAVAAGAMDPAYSPDSAVIDVMQRVIGGNLAAQGQFPSIVALLDPGELFSPADRQFCGGTVIDERWVLTAAHCVHDDFARIMEPSALRVVEGVLDLRADQVEELVVATIYVHPDYDHGSLASFNDIALLEMATALASEPALLFDGDPENYTGQTAVIAGWGATEFLSQQSVSYPDALHHASVPLVSRAVCNVPASYDGLVGEGQLCAGFVDGGVDSCLGDSGGPLYTGARGRVELIGVTSFGRGCAEPDYYGIYTNVSSQRDWIGQYVALEGTTPRGSAGAPAGDSGSSGSGAAWWLSGMLLGAMGLRRRRLSSSGIRP